jgi:hypothetical protein
MRTLGSIPILNILGGKNRNKGSEAVVDFFSSTGKNQMKRDIYCICIHAELQPRTNVDGEADATQTKEQSETKYK